MAIQDQIDRLNAEVEEQAALIAEISDILATKAGGAGGGAKVETCTVTITALANSDLGSGCICLTTYENGAFNAISPEISQLPHITNNVVVGSAMGVDYSTGNLRHDSGSEHTLELVAQGSFAYTYKVVGDCSFGFYVCLAKDTRILLADGQTMAIQDITMDDLLATWDFDSGNSAASKPLWIKRTEVADYYYRCEFENGTMLRLIGSGGKCHRVFSIDENTFLSATDCVGHMVMTRNGAVRLLSCERVDEPVEFYNIITERHLNLYAEGVLTSTRLNNLYPIRDMMFVKEVRTITPNEAYPGVPSEYYHGLRLGERKKEDIEWLLPYVQRLLSLRRVE